MPEPRGRGNLQVHINRSPLQVVSRRPSSVISRSSLRAPANSLTSQQAKLAANAHQAPPAARSTLSPNYLRAPVGPLRSQSQGCAGQRISRIPAPLSTMQQGPKHEHQYSTDEVTAGPGARRQFQKPAHPARREMKHAGQRRYPAVLLPASNGAASSSMDSLHQRGPSPHSSTTRRHMCSACFRVHSKCPNQGHC